MRVRYCQYTSLLRSLLSENNFNYLNSQSHIFPIITGNVHSTKEVSLRLLEKGIFAQGAIYPSVPMNKGRLRITISPDHNEEDINFLVQSLKEVRSEFISSFGSSD